MLFNKRNLFALVAVFGLWTIASTASAVTPANTQLTNAARLTYLGNATGISDAVTVTIELVPAAPSIAAGASAPNTSVNQAENTAYSATYVLQSNANGPDDYTLAAIYTATNDVSNQATPTTSVPSIELGATAAAAASSGLIITVPSDGNSDAEVNGLIVGEDVVINGVQREITAITDNATGTSTISVDLAVVVNPGDGIYEFKSFTVDITDVGDQTGGGATFRLDQRTTATSVASPGTAQYLFDVDINIVAITITKFVRDTAGSCATPACGSATTTSYDTDGGGPYTFYDAGVEVAPGDTLEYLLVITTSTATISGAVVDDDLPDFSAYEPNTTRLNGIAVDDEASAPVFPLDIGADDSGLLIDDNATRTAGTEGDGDVGTSQTVYISYEVTIDS